MVLLTSCGTLNGCCYVYDVQHVEGCLMPFLQDAYYSVLQVCKVCFVHGLLHLEYRTAFLTGCPTWCL